MINLEELNNKFDKLFEDETSESLTKWILNKRYGKLNELLGDGVFVSLERKEKPFFLTKKQKPKFTQQNGESPNTPINRQAA